MKKQSKPRLSLSCAKFSKAYASDKLAMASKLDDGETVNFTLLCLNTLKLLGFNYYINVGWLGGWMGGWLAGSNGNG